ncbi:MAG: YmfQ family protein [Bacillota bacterium]
MLGTNLNPNVYQRMMDMLPYYYRESAVVNAIITSQSEEVDKLNHDVSDLLDQFFVPTATWAISRWETICGIKSNESLDIEIRRAQVMSKIRGQGTSTIAMIKSVAESYKNGEVEVSENNPQYEVIITFVGKKGIPTNLDSIKKAIMDIIPAHLALMFRFTWLTWDELEAKMATWDMIETHNGTGLTWDELEIWQ